MMSRTEGERGSWYCDDAWCRGEGCERLHDITHVIFAAGPGQGVVDDSASIQEIQSTYQNFYVLCLLLQIIQKIYVVFETHIDL